MARCSKVCLSRIGQPIHNHRPISKKCTASNIIKTDFQPTITSYTRLSSYLAELFTNPKLWVLSIAYDPIFREYILLLWLQNSDKSDFLYSPSPLARGWGDKKRCIFLYRNTIKINASWVIGAPMETVAYC